jgi:MinD-like ATPase involved in chromosome partitioning or flagellar assembly
MTTGIGMVITFYSWKGGVGRTMALANTAVQLARKGNRVLMVDWDLEAPGLINYFAGRVAQQTKDLGIAPAEYSRGLLGLLSDASLGGDKDASAWKAALRTVTISPDSPTYRNPTPPQPGQLDLLPSGYGDETYAKDLSEFSWPRFFAESDGGVWLESLRNQWMANYEFVLIDSRTGLTDSGGVCTIQMPDALVLVFTANEQSLDDGLKIVAAAQNARQSFAFERAPLTVAPLLSRWEGEKEVDLGEEWMARFDVELKHLVASWLLQDFSPKDFLRKLRVPHVARFSFGEPLPVVTHTIEDPTLPGLAFESLAQLLHAKFANGGELIDPTTN